MRISIIIPVYNAESFIDSCLDSIFNQDLKSDDFEILIIDDGSTDNSLSLARKRESEYHNISVFHQSNQGQASARNVGLSYAKGKYVVFVDSDDYLLPHTFHSLLEILDKNELDALIYRFVIQNKDGSTKPQDLKNFIFNNIYSGEEIVLRSFIFGSMCQGIFLRSVFMDNALHFRTGIAHEDAELCFRLFPLLKRVMFVDKAVYFYRYNIESTDRSSDRNKLIKNIESDAVLSSLILKDTESNIYSDKIKKRYQQISKSIMIGFFYRLRNCKIWSINEFDAKITWLTSIGVYPIKGRTNSWKSYILAKLLNNRSILKYYLFRV